DDSGSRTSRPPSTIPITNLWTELFCMPSIWLNSVMPIVARLTVKQSSTWATRIALKLRLAEPGATGRTPLVFLLLEQRYNNCNTRIRRVSIRDQSHTGLFVSESQRMERIQISGGGFGAGRVSSLGVCFELHL